MKLRNDFTITEESRQLILLALALMVVGPRPGFDHAALRAAAELGGGMMYLDFKRFNTEEPTAMTAQPAEAAT